MAVGSAFAQNPSVQAGQTATFPAPGNPHHPPQFGTTWDIVDNAGGVVASNSAPNGWAVVVAARSDLQRPVFQFQVTAPITATGAQNYEVRYNAGPFVDPWQPSGIYLAIFDVLEDNLEPVPYLAVYATGANSIRVYWKPVPNALAYKIFRATQSGSYDLTQPIATVGSSVTWYDDLGLTTGQVYFYVVQVMRMTGDSALSEEDSHVPYAGAIPWNGTADAIVDTAWQQILSQPALDYTDRINVRVMAPDGIIYSGESSTALPPDGTLDPAASTETLDDRIPTSVEPSMFPAQVVVQPNQAQTQVKNLTLGGIRKVVSTKADANGNLFTGVNGTFYLPPASANMFVSTTPNIYATPGTSPHAYVGISGTGIQIDAGVNFENPLPKGSLLADGTTLPDDLPARWNAVLRVSDHQPDADNGYDNHHFTVGSWRVMGKKAGRKYIWADSPLGNAVKLSCTVDRVQRSVSCTVGANDGGLYYGLAFVAAASIQDIDPVTHFPLPLRDIHFKRVLSLDQSLPPGTNYTGFDNQIFTVVNGVSKLDPQVQPGYIQDGSFMENFYWQNGKLWVGSAGQDWTTSSVEQYTNDPQNLLYRKNKFYYRSDFTTKLFTTSYGMGDPANERIEIHH